MNCNITRQEALALLQKYNKEPFHIQHALTVEGVMRYFAGETGNGEEEEYWGIVGLLHDIEGAGAAAGSGSVGGNDLFCLQSRIWNLQRIGAKASDGEDIVRLR